jgi:hypothetical protein
MITARVVVARLAQVPRFFGGVAALLLLAASPGAAQQLAAAVVGARQPLPVDTRSASAARYGLPIVMPAQDTARGRSVAPYLLIGALVGGVVGLVLESDFHDDFCSGEFTSCSSDWNGIGLVIGAGVGMLGGLIIYAVSASEDTGIVSSHGDRLVTGWGRGDRIVSVSGRIDRVLQAPGSP